MVSLQSKNQSLFLQEHLKLALFLLKRGKLVPQVFNLHASTLHLASQVLQLLVILVPDWVTNVSEDSRVFLEPVRVLEIFKVASRLNSMLGAHLLVDILSISLLTVLPCNVLTKETNIPNQVQVIAHDQDIVSLMDLTFNL